VPDLTQVSGGLPAMPESAPTPHRSLVRRLSSLLLYTVTAGILLAALAFPATAFVGLVAASAGTGWDDLPSDLRVPPTAQASRLYASDGTLITTFYDENRTDVALSDVAPTMQQAIVAAEDTRFYQHQGVDLKSVVRALVADASRGRADQGGSTLTMQYVRNVLKNDPQLSPQQRIAATANTLGRKVQEIRYAIALEKRLSKQEILQRYLNIAYFGAGAYGIDAASETYFSKPPSQLTLAQAALLAGLVQSPDANNPISGDRAAALNRRSYVLDSMLKTNAISAEQAEQAKGEPLTLQPSQPPNGCAAGPDTGWGFFCDYVRQWWDSQPAFGATAADRDNALRRGGYRITAALNPGIQANAQAQVLSVYGYNNRRALPMAVVEPGTGRVQAMAVNRHYSLAPNPRGAKYPNTANQLIAGGDSVSGYPSGSTFKLFTLLAALEQGIPLNTGFDAPSPLVTHWPASGPGSCGGRYCPVNANPAWMDGHRTMWTGYGRSVNTYFVWLEEQIGAQNAVAMAKRLGIVFRAASDAQLAATQAASWGSFTLGVADTTPLDLANAYATVAADGLYCRPLPVLAITDSAGQPSSAAAPVCHQAVSPDVARGAVDAARCPVGQQSQYNMCDGGTAQAVANVFGGRPVAGKTGSAENNATEAFVGFTPQLAAAAIAANPDDPRDYVGSGVSADVNLAVARTLAAAVRGLPYRDFPAPSSAVAFGGRP
jgi:membrane peptidoglycan carboxypeptidase